LAIALLTYEQKMTVLQSYGFTVGDRDPRLNTNYPGSKIVVEAHDESELPTQDGRDGPWCLVGDDLSILVEEAFDWASNFDRFELVVSIWTPSRLRRRTVTRCPGIGAPTRSSSEISILVI